MATIQLAMTMASHLGLLWSSLLTLGLLLAACGPAGGPATRESSNLPGVPAAPKSLTLGLEAEPLDPFVGSLGTGSGTVAGNLRLAVHQTLAHYDDRGGLFPMLARELPSRDAGTWVVRPDGTMQTTYRLRPGITWHDGTPLTSKDFVFGWTIIKDPDLPQSRRGLTPQIERIDTPDDATIVIEWIKTYPFAHAITSDDVGPMPAHLLDELYRADKERFVQLPYWTREFVGVGPYRLAEWEAGSHLTLKAYNGFYGGRAKIDTLVFRFIPSAPTATANMLAGAIDGAIPRTLDFTQVMFIKDEWERAGKKPVAIVQPTHWRILEPQFRDPRLAEILDVRLRRGLLHAIDRQAMVDTLLAGVVPVSDTFIPPHDAKWQWVSDVTARYPYDQRQAHELLAQVGWRRAGDGSYLNAGGERVTVPLATSAGEQSEQEQAIIAASWRGLGLDVEQQVRTTAEARENRLNSIFPGFSASALPLTFENTTMRLHSSSCPSEPRWAGPNHGCYRNADMDRMADALQIAIDPAQQRQLYRDLVKWQTEELPAYPLYFNVQALIFREGITGVRGDTVPRTAPTWNVAEWDVK